MNLYVDASAFVKLLIREPGSDDVAELWAKATWISSSRLLYVEARAALAAASRHGRIRRQTAARVRQRLEELLIDVDAVELDIGLASAAGELADRHSLTASDAIHLASALSLPNEQAVIVSWDERLRQASREAGLAVAPAEV